MTDPKSELTLYILERLAERPHQTMELRYGAEQALQSRITVRDVITVLRELAEQNKTVTTPAGNGWRHSLKLFLVLAFAVSVRAHAGWWTDFCERHLIADDPYQFETASTEWLIREVRWLEAAREPTAHELSLIRILRSELERRALFSSDQRKSDGVQD